MKDITLIGIDGGASKVSVHVVEFDGQTFSLGKYSSIKSYIEFADYLNDFEPVDLKSQLSQIRNNSIELTESEISHANAYFDAFTEAIIELVQKTNANEILIGIGMPGIKSADSRGIIAMANGPRMPNFASEIEQRISANHIALAKPIFKLGSDADYCGIGEEFAQKGAFRNIKNSYYLGGGTGAADALKLHGKLIPMDNCKTWFAKTWELKTDNGKSMEVYCSARGIQSIYGQIIDAPQSELINNNIYLEQILQFAVNGQEGAIQTWDIISKNIAELIFERILTIYSGWQNNFSFINPTREKLNSNHGFKRTLLDQIVIGQRLGNLLRNDSADSLIVAPIFKHLERLILENEILDDIAKSHYLKNGKFIREILTTSKLREAPALGAGIDAWNNYVKS